MRRPEEGPAEVFIEAVVRLVWGLRVEIALGGGAVTAGAVLSAHLGPVCGVRVVAVLVAAACGVAPLRRLRARGVFRARNRRQCRRGGRTARLSAWEDRRPLLV